MRFVKGALQEGINAPAVHGEYVLISLHSIINGQVTRTSRSAIQDDRCGRLSRGDVFNGVVNAEISGVEIRVAGDESDFRTL